jgi:nucleoside 2-deoxyribosyltransferase
MNPRNRAVETATSEKVYISAPLYDEEEQAGLDKLIDKLQDIGYIVIVPDKAAKPTPGLYESNLREIRGCSIFIAIVDDFDPAIVWEAAYAFAKNKPILALSTQSTEINMMLAHSVRAHFKDEKSFIKAMKQTGKTGILPKNTTKDKVVQ